MARAYLFMKYKNISHNTIYIQDIDLSIPFDEDVKEISRDQILRSPGFQQLLLLNQLEAVEYGDSRIEKNLERMVEKMAKLKSIMGNVHKESPEKEENEAKDNSVVIKGHFLEGGGYAKCNRNLALGLAKKGIDVKIEVVGNGKSELSADEAKALASLRGHSGKHSIKIDSLIPSFGNVSAGRHCVLFTTIEAGTVPQQFIDVSNQYHEVWVTSDFCKKVLIESGVKRPISVVPNSIDTDLYTPDGDKYEFNPPLKNFVFISVFGWSYRKGYDVLLRSYLKAFNGDDDVSLLLVSKSQKGKDHIKKEVDSFIKEYGGDNPPHIVRCSKAIPEAEMPKLYRACDAFVLFSRGEGFGLPYCEASLCGLPVIGTACSGQKMFLNQLNSSLLGPNKYSKVPPGKMHVHYWDNQVFPELNSSHEISIASSIMQDVFYSKEHYVAKNEKLREHILSNYSIDAVTDKVIGKLKDIGGP